MNVHRPSVALKGPRMWPWAVSDQCWRCWQHFTNPGVTCPGASPGAGPGAPLDVETPPPPVLLLLPDGGRRIEVLGEPRQAPRTTKPIASCSTYTAQREHLLAAVTFRWFREMARILDLILPPRDDHQSRCRHVYAFIFLKIGVVPFISVTIYH